MIPDEDLIRGVRSIPVSSVEESISGKQVLVTGATGFIGSHLVDRLVNLNAEVTALAPSLGWRPMVKNYVEQGHARFIELREFWSSSAIDQLKSVFKGIEYVIHLAYVMPSGKNSIETTIDDTRKNVLGTLQIVQSISSSVSKFCFASSTKVYGLNPKLPVSESNNVHPDTPYTSGKITLENCLHILSEESEISISILRFSTVYGRYETVPRAIPNFIRSVLAGSPPIVIGKGDEIRDYVHVSDVVEGIILALVNDGEPCQVLNIGSGKGFSTVDIAGRIVELAGKELEPIHAPAKHMPGRIICDISRARRALGYEPKIELNNGLADEIKFFSDHPNLWRKSWTN